MSEQVVSLTSEIVSDPAQYTELREQGLTRATLPDLETPVWLITRYEEAKAALSDPRFVRDSSKLPGQDGPSIADQMIEAYGLPADYSPYLGILVLADGEEHARLRNLITRSFTARRIAGLRPQIEQIVDDLYAKLSAKGEGDLLEELGYPLAATVICELIGIDQQHHAQMTKWIREYASGDPELFIPALKGMVEHCKDLIVRRREEPAEDLISELVRAADEEEDALTETEIVAVFLLLINTGITPPATFICDSILTLFDHSEQLDKLRQEPELLATRAIPELLRFTSPVPMGAPLYATEDMEFGGCPIKQGDVVTGSLMGVNHDPAEFDAPDKLDISRKLGRGVGHLALGHGAHYCIGAALARLETEVVLDRLLIKHDGLELAVPRDELVYKPLPGEGIHLAALPVRF
ncbi:cytochrome P450 [Streptomyces sp. NPDC059009]|uniref:cytochrome P450 family protein n=1 Tax=Streptomyces sp. NPDC059009 TaxID=3346694 RepID=UPI003687F749